MMKRVNKNKNLSVSNIIMTETKNDTQRNKMCLALTSFSQLIRNEERIVKIQVETPKESLSKLKKKKRKKCHSVSSDIDR